MLGTGSITTPYLIANRADLNNIRNAPFNHDGVHFRLVRDIDLGVGGNWTPIPDFRGIFDGNFRVIKNMTIIRDVPNLTDYDHGLFGRMTGNFSRIRNLGLENIEISIFSGGSGRNQPSYNCGALVGAVDTQAIPSSGENPPPFVIENCYATGTIQCNVSNTNSNNAQNPMYIGGLIGVTRQGGRVQNC